MQKFADQMSSKDISVLINNAGGWGGVGWEGWGGGTVGGWGVGIAPVSQGQAWEDEPPPPPPPPPPTTPPPPPPEPPTYPPTPMRVRVREGILGSHSVKETGPLKGGLSAREGVSRGGGEGGSERCSWADTHAGAHTRQLPPSLSPPLQATPTTGTE